jgi:uncharacterized membrane protein YhhN
VPFAIGHVVAVWLYLRNRREAQTPRQRLQVLLIVPATVGLAVMLPGDRSGVPGIALYALLLSSMTAAAWGSRFPRSRVGIGALMFVASDLLLFAQLGPLDGVAGVGFAVWLLYFGGQTLICLGVTSTLATRPAALDTPIALP